MIKKIVKSITPPVLVSVASAIKNIFKKENNEDKFGWFAGYSSFKEASCQCSGYDCDLILRKCSDSLNKVKIGECVYERDSVLFDKIEYSFPLLSSLLWITSKNDNKLSIIDFGGSLGSSYYQNRKFFEHLNVFEWSIIEQNNFVTEGKKEFENKDLKFYYDIDECLKERSPDALLLSSVLQYIEKPYELLSIIEKYNFKYVIFDRTGFVNSESDIVTKQVVPDVIYKADYPCWFFNEEKFLNFFKKNYFLVYDFTACFDSTIQINGSDNKVEYKGFLFERK